MAAALQMVHTAVYERTEDLALIRRVLTNPRIYPHITDDNCPAVEDFEPQLNPNIWYIHAADEIGTVGIFLLIPQNSVCYELHTCLLPEAWGVRAKHAAQYLGPWVWENTPAQRVVTNVPEYNHIARAFAGKGGMTMFGINPRSFLKDGKLHDQFMLGISKPEAN